MDASLVRAFLGALPDAPADARSRDRVRFCLSALLGPDVRYLVAPLLGADAPGIARVTAAVLRAAGASTAVFAGTLGSARLDGDPIDDALLARAGTFTAASGYQLAGGGLGELTRCEAETILALCAFAEAGRRVVLLVDDAVRPDDALHAPRPDVVVIGAVDRAAAVRAMSLVPEGCPVVTTPLTGDALAYVDAGVKAAGIPAMIGGRDHAVAEDRGELVFSVRGERYVSFAPVDGISCAVLAGGIAAALALGAMGIRMREEWVTSGVASLRVGAATR